MNGQPQNELPLESPQNPTKTNNSSVTFTFGSWQKRKKRKETQKKGTVGEEKEKRRMLFPCYFSLPIQYANRIDRKTGCSAFAFAFRTPKRIKYRTGYARYHFPIHFKKYFCGNVFWKWLFALKSSSIKHNNY